MSSLVCCFSPTGLQWSMAEKPLSKEIQLPEYLGSFDTNYIISKMLKFSQILFPRNQNFVKKIEESLKIFLEIFYFVAIID
jgi:hypothetical protein